MFTGIVEAVGRIESIAVAGGTHKMTVAAPSLAGMLHIGDSVAVSGVCLTAVNVTDAGFTADMAEETWTRTSFSRLTAGAAVNLELPLKAESRMGGHMVQGHVDGLGRLLRFDKIPGASDYWLEIEAPEEMLKYLVFKGSIAIEGISLTVARLEGNKLSVAIIPHTCEATNLSTLKAGDVVNLEADIAAKYLEKWTGGGQREGQGVVSKSEVGRYGIVVSRFNSLITERLLAGAKEALERLGVPAEAVKSVSVPGAYEIPVTAKWMAESGAFDAVICLGCLLRGETLHYEVIAQETARGIGHSALETGVPHAFGVLTCNTAEEALNRVGLKSGNKGSEAAEAAFEMVRRKKEIAAFAMAK